MHAVSKNLVVPVDLLRDLNDLQIIVCQVQDLLAPHTDDVMVLRCHRIVSIALVKGCQPRDDAVPLERVERLVDRRVRIGRMA